MHAIGDYGFSGPCPFVKGRRYKVRQNFKALRSEFQAGEVLIFESRAWSRYDGITGYFFSRQSGGGAAWDVGDEDEAAGLPKWRELFEELAQEGAE